MSSLRFKHLVMLVIVIRSAATLRAAPPANAGTGQSDANLAVVVEGNIAVKRQGWNTYAPVVFGTKLQAGDLVRVNPESHAKVVCSDLTVHELPSGIAGIPCTSAREILHGKDGSAIVGTRGALTSGIPTVLSPRKTRLLSAHPILQWADVPGTGVYIIAIRGPQGILWGATGSKTSYAYPDSAPRLKPDIDYKLIVAAGDRRSNEEQAFGLGFSILNDKQRHEIEKEQHQISNLGLPAQATEYLIAYLYSSYDLRAEAIQRLEKLSAGTQVSAIPHLLGDLYLQIGLPRQAENSYLKALALCEHENDEEGEMWINLALGTIYGEALGNRDSARKRLDVALGLANRIGDSKIKSQVDIELSKLNKVGV